MSAAIRRIAFSRLRQSGYMPDSFTIGRGSTEVADGSGGYTLTPSTVASGVKGRFRAATASEVEIGGGTIGMVGVIVEMEAFADVRAQDSLTVLLRGSEPAHTFQVVGNLSQSDELVTRVLATEV